MVKVLIQNSAIELDAAAALMDDAIREELHAATHDADREDAALDWYNAAPKDEMIEFCAARGVDILVPGERRLVPGWEEIVIDLRKAQLFADDYCRRHAERYGEQFSAG